jgi:glycosyltransferase involved in cell wall biosynthesis
MRVLHLLKTSVGASWALLQVRELVRLGVDVHVALPAGGAKVGRYAELGATEHLLQTDFPVRAPWRFPELSARFPALVREITPDIIHSHFVGTTLSMRLSLGRSSVPRVFQVPGPLHLEHPLFRNAELATSSDSDYWIGSCRWTCDRYRRSGIDPSRIFLSYYGTDVDTYAPQAPGKLRRELGLGPESRLVGMVAYMYAPKRYLGQRRGLKGHEDLIDAFRICLERDPQARCVIVGGAWNNAAGYEASVRSYAREKCGDRVIFLGTRHDVPDIYADLDVAVHPSHSENVGGAVESCLLGVPTIATSVGGFPDLIRDGSTGWLVPPKDPPALADAITAALADASEARRRAEAGQRLARELFDVRSTAAEVAKIYRAILSGRK